MSGYKIDIKIHSWFRMTTLDLFLFEKNHNHFTMSFTIEIIEMKSNFHQYVVKLKKVGVNSN